MTKFQESVVHMLALRAVDDKVMREEGVCPSGRYCSVRIAPQGLPFYGGAVSVQVDRGMEAVADRWWPVVTGKIRIPYTDCPVEGRSAEVALLRKFRCDLVCDMETKTAEWVPTLLEEETRRALFEIKYSWFPPETKTVFPKIFQS